MIRYAVAAGNWSNPATWDGGTLPAPEDDVYANGKTVAVDLPSLTINSLKNISLASPVIASSGYFAIDSTLNEVNLTITAGIRTTDIKTTGVVQVQKGTNLFTVNGPSFQGGTNASERAIYFNDSRFTGPAIVNGDVVGGVSSYTAAGIEMNQPPSDLTINGNVIGMPSCAGVRATSVTRNVTFTVNGDVLGSTGTYYAIDVQSSGTSITTIFVNGTVYGGLAETYPVGIYASSELHLTATRIEARRFHAVRIAGNFAGNSVVSDYIVGSGVSAVSHGVSVDNSMTCSIRGKTMISNTAPAISAGSGSNVRVSGTLFFTAGFGSCPIKGPWVSINGEELSMVFLTDPRQRYSTPLVAVSRYGLPYPLSDNVRSGVSFGESLVGSLQLPAPSSVAKGVPIDSSVGTASFSLSALADITGTQISLAESG